MSRFVGKCPVNECDFKKESYWKNAARGGIVLHVYQTEDKGHGSKGSCPRENLKI